MRLCGLEEEAAWIEKYRQLWDSRAIDQGSNLEDLLI
jgi:hypothetical protein